MTADEFRSLAMALPGVIQAAHQGHADFRVRGKIFATLGYPDDQWGMVRLAPEEQAKRLRQAPAAFVPAKGACGEQGSTPANLRGATAETSRRAMTRCAGTVGVRASLGGQPLTYNRRLVGTGPGRADDRGAVCAAGDLGVAPVPSPGLKRRRAEDHMNIGVIGSGTVAQTLAA